MTPTRDENGHLLAFVWPGGYPLYYVSKYGLTLCVKCANTAVVMEAEVNWEDPMLWCEACSTRIESAYAEDGHPDRT